VSDERHITEVEDLLREVGAPPTPPAHMHDIARDAALGSGEVIEFASRVRPRGRGGRLLLAAAVLTASAAAALVIGVGGNALRVDRTVQMRGIGSQSSASAVIDFGATGSGPLRDVVLHVDNLSPAPDHGYYELWMQNGRGGPIGLVAFNTSGSGHVVVRTAMPSGLSWTRCWVTVERPNGSDVPVMRAA
jgi:anti-sigma-K factor RskA